MNDVIKEKAFHLKHDQARNKAIRVAQSRNKTHHAVMDTDRKNRPRYLLTRLLTRLLTHLLTHLLK